MKNLKRSLTAITLSILLLFSPSLFSQTPKPPKPLMKSAQTLGEEFTFEWQEPSPEYEYTLLIYRGKKSKKPILSLPVKGGLKKLTLKKDSEKIYWRVNAKAPDGQEFKNRAIFVVKNSQKIEESKKTEWVLRIGFLGALNSYKQDAQDSALNVANSSSTLSGTNLFFRTEGWREKYGVLLGLKSQSLSSGSIKYQETEYAGEVGYHWRKTAMSKQDLAVGMNYSQTKVKFNGNNGDYTRAFFTFRHRYEKLLSMKYSWGLDTIIMQPAQTEISIPSIRLTPSMNWYFKDNWWLSGMVGYEKNEAVLKYQQAGNSGNLKVSSNILTYGLSINWKSF
jgi:hypothetical protein